MEIAVSTPRALLALTLARALLPPAEDASAELFGYLADDLGELGTELGLTASVALAALREASDRGAEEPPLVHYSRLFLGPPPRVHLNLGWYLDGSLNGNAQEALARWHARLAVERRADFKELPDHLAAVLELLALMESQQRGLDAAAFVAGLLAPVLPRLECDLMAVDGHSPYRALIGWMAAALDQLYPQHAGVRRPKAFGNWRGRAEWRYCTRCGSPIATRRDLAVMEKALAQAGLPTAHLTLCGACRDEQQGWTHRALPTLG